MQTLQTQHGGHHGTSQVTPDAHATAPVFRGAAPVTIVLTASVGGAASAPIDSSVRVAPLRSSSALRDVPQWDPYQPWDPWSETRIGYDAPAQACLLYPPHCVLQRLFTYLRHIST
jgi:hypothetical protein